MMQTSIDYLINHQVQWRPANVEFYPMRQSLSPGPDIAKNPKSPTNAGRKFAIHPALSTI